MRDRLSFVRFLGLALEERGQDDYGPDTGSLRTSCSRRWAIGVECALEDGPFYKNHVAY